MSIKQHLASALSSIKVDKERAISVTKEKTMREEIVPRHAEINKARDEAISKITENYNGKVAELQKAFNEEKNEILQAAEKKKDEVTNATIECAIAASNLQYDKAIQMLEEQIAKYEE